MTPIDITQVLLWQYNDAEKLQQLIFKHQEWIDANHNQFWDDWYRDVFDLRTANDFGCAVWASILGVSFATQVSDGTKRIFGFGTYYTNFYQSNFSAVASGAVQLTTVQKRMILMLRYLRITSSATVPEINFALKELFGDAYIVDNYDMTITIVFPTTPESTAKYILQNYDVLPVPSTVELIYT